MPPEYDVPNASSFCYGGNTMKSTSLACIAATMLLALTTSAQSRFVTLVIGATNVLDEVTIGTNEVAAIKSSFDPDDNGNAAGPSVVEVAKGNQVFRLFAAQFSPGRGGYRGPIAIAGPARLSLKFQNPPFSYQAAFLTVEIQPESFPPDKTLIIPADTKGANILMEASADLIHWTNAPPGLYTNQPSHLFFRLRAERIP